MRPGWAEVRVRGTLPPLGTAATGGVAAYELQVLENTAVEVSLYQRNGRGRPDVQMADLLILVLQRGASGGDGASGLSVAGMRLVAASERKLHACVTCDAQLSAGSYYILPLSLRPREGASAFKLGLDYVVRVGSAKPLLLEPTYLSDAEIAAALGSYVKGGGKWHRAFEDMGIYSRHDGAGWLSYAENISARMSFRVELDESDSFNVLPSRGSLNTMDILPPGKGQLLQVLTDLPTMARACPPRCASRPTTAPPSCTVPTRKAASLTPCSCGRAAAGRKATQCEASTMGSLTCCARWAFATFNTRCGRPSKDYRGVGGVSGL